MIKILICMYNRNIKEFVPLCYDQGRVICLAFNDDTNLDEYIESVRSLIGSDRNIILTDEWGGSPFLGALIAGAMTDSIIISDVDVPLCRKIINFINEGNDPDGLSDFVPSERYFVTAKTKGDITS